MNLKRRLETLLVCCTLIAGCSDNSSSNDSGAPDVAADLVNTIDQGNVDQGTGDLPTTLALTRAFTNLQFTRPVEIIYANDGTDRFFVVEQAGVIKVFPNEPNVMPNQVTTYLDIRNIVNDSGNEEGLLGLAFHPDFQQNGYFYLNFTTATHSRIARFSRQSADAADPGSQLVLLEEPQPASNHNGGCLRFGPDGLLYISLGDGGSSNDPDNHGQRLNSLLGKILRIDVDNAAGGNNYAIPASNPFVSTQGARPEIYAYGLRNVWRFSFDSQTGALWAGDVGQNAWEEIDIIENGKNYGWKIMEGEVCRPGGDPSCDMTGLELPVWVYPQVGFSSVTGGIVYRGSRFPALRGAYVYADFVNGQVWRLFNGAPVDNALIEATALNVASIGTDGQGELYFLDLSAGHIYALTD